MQPAYPQRNGPGGGGGGVTDHASLTGLEDIEDHLQYHNDDRADTWLAANHETTYPHADYDAHLPLTAPHRVIDDEGTSATVLFSAERILALIAGYAAIGHSHGPAETPILQVLPVLESAKWYGLGLNGWVAVTSAGVADQMDLAPFCPGRDLTIQTTRLEVTSAVASSNAKIAVYANNAGAGNLPGALIWGTSDIATTSTGLKTAAQSYTFLRGVQYWVGVHRSTTQTFRCLGREAMAALVSPGSSNGAHYAYRVSSTYASGLPDPCPAGTFVGLSNFWARVEFQAA